MSETENKCSICFHTEPKAEKELDCECKDKFYHEDCIEKWLNHKGTCPFCRKKIKEPDITEEDELIEIFRVELAALLYQEYIETCVFCRRRVNLDVGNEVIRLECDNYGHINCMLEFTQVAIQNFQGREYIPCPRCFGANQSSQCIFITN